jgi:DNA-directed RNA polymerase specialized sigma24 family protein
LAQEALQESFMRYFMVRGEGQPIENGKAWLLRVLHNSGPVAPKRFWKPKIKY